MSLKPETMIQTDPALKAQLEVAAAPQTEISDAELERIAGGTGQSTTTDDGGPIDNGRPRMPLPGERPELDDSRAWG